MSQPNFLVAGVAKCGTTSLFFYLEQHPEVCIPKKETFYFIRDFYKNQTNDLIGQRKPSQLILTEEAYNNLYQKCGKVKAIGEVSTCYFHFPDMAIPEIKAKLGNPKVIIILREPVSRAWSNYTHFKRGHQEPLCFEDALLAQQERREKRWDFMWDYTSLGFYADYVERYQKEFSDVLILFNEDLENKPLETMQQLFKFIGIDPSFVPDTTTRYNIGDLQDKNPWFKLFIRNNFVRTVVRPIVRATFSATLKQKIRHKLRRKNTGPKETMKPETKEKLKALYREDIIRLQSLTGRDLSTWLNG